MKRFDVRFVERINQSLVGIEASEFLGFVRPKCQEAITFEELLGLLRKHDELRIKFGIDPTGSEVHLGHVVPIMLLQLFAKAGNAISLVIGDFTASVGDPTGRENSRAPLNREQINSNLSRYSEQIGRYIDLEGINVVRNSSWLSTMPLSEIFSIFQGISLSEAVQRDDFRKRAKNNEAVSLAEICYGALMGIDSVNLRSQVEIGGIDQLLNFQQCRSVMRHRHLPEEVVLMTPILEGTSADGRKMSKSFDNYIAVDASISDKFGKVMSIPDRLIGQYFRSFADVHESELDELDGFIKNNPFEAKKQLAVFIVALETKNIEDGEREREEFERKFSRRDIRAEDCVTIESNDSETVLDALARSGSFQSKGQIRRLFDQQAVRFREDGGEKEEILDLDAKALALRGGVVRVGKRRFFRIVVLEVGSS